MKIGVGNDLHAIFHFLRTFNIFADEVKLRHMGQTTADGTAGEVKEGLDFSITVQNCSRLIHHEEAVIDTVHDGSQLNSGTFTLSMEIGDAVVIAGNIRVVQRDSPGQYVIGKIQSGGDFCDGIQRQPALSQ
ncbi:MAG: hypothetical protein J6E42_08470 [Firmicutes bacterium]|nr:hypothetical protein [Bacillota bacterium]